MPYRQTIQELEAATLTNAREGLSEKEAAARLQRFGGNELAKKKEESLLKKIADVYKRQPGRLCSAAAAIVFTGVKKTRFPIRWKGR